jgi:hypothetical protein
MSRWLLGRLGAVMAIAAAGCGQAGMPYVTLDEAARLGVGTGRITVACGTADELRAFGGAQARGLTAQESIAESGVQKLAAVYGHDQTHTYQGESVGAVLHDTASLLGTCRLDQARRQLLRVLEHPHS